MPSSVARMTPLQVRRELLVATATAQRLQLAHDLASAGKAARDSLLGGILRTRSYGKAASVAVFLLATVATLRRSRQTRRTPRFTPPPERPQPSRTVPPTPVSILTQALPILRVLLSVWLEHRASHPRRS